MKKLIVLLTIFASSFFLFNGDVKADEVVIEYEDYSLVESEDFKNIKKLAEDTLPSTGRSNFVILYYKNFNDDTKSAYRLYYFTADSLSLNYGRKVISGVVATKNDYCISGGTGYSYYTYDSTSNSLNLYGSYDTSSFELYISNYGYVNSGQNYIVYSSVPIVFTDYLNQVVLKFVYPDVSYTYYSSKLNEEVPTLYDVYKEYIGIEEENPHQEELDKIEKFYNVLFERLSYFANIIVSNYVYLSMIVVMIIVLVFSMIFRRYL